MDFLVGLFLPVLSKILQSTFLAGFATASHLHDSKALKAKGLPGLSRRGRRSINAERQVSLPDRGSLPKAPPNDPQRQGNIWHRYEQLEAVSQQLASVNQQVKEERLQFRKDKKHMEDALLELEGHNMQLAVKLQVSPGQLSPESMAVLRSLHNDSSAPKAAPASSQQQQSMDMARTLSLALPPINTHPEPKADINAVEDLRALNDSLMARNNQLAEEMSQLQGRHRQLVDELDAARSLVETPRSSGTHTPTQGRLHEMLQARITRLEERNRAMIADRARAGFGSQQNSPYGTPRGSFSNLHGSQSPFAPFSGSGDAGELKQQNSVLHDEITKLRLELSAARAEKQAWEQGRLSRSGDSERVRELEASLAVLKGEVNTLRSSAESGSVAGIHEQAGDREAVDIPLSFQPPPRPPSATSRASSMRSADGLLTSAPSIGGGISAAALDGKNSERDALQAYGNLQVSVAGLQEENKRLQQKLMRVEAAAARASELEAAMQRLTQENTRLQSKVLRFDLGQTSSENPRADAVSRAQFEALQEENSQLRVDNDKLVEYLESLEAKLEKGSSAEDKPAGGNAADLDRSASSSMAMASVDSFVQLKSKNSELQEDNVRLANLIKQIRSQAEEAARSSPNVTTIPIPVVLDSKEELDKDLWVTLEDLHTQNRQLLKDNARFKQAQKASASPLARRSSGMHSVGETEGAAAEVEKLQRQLAAVMESRAAEINDDNIRLVNHLSEENAGLQADVQRLMRKLSAGAPVAAQEATMEALQNNERLAADRAKVMAECRRLAEKNTRLIEENETLIQRLGTAASPSSRTTAENAARASRDLKSSPSGMLKRFGFGRRKDSRGMSKDMDDASSTASAEPEPGSFSQMRAEAARNNQAADGAGERPTSPPDHLVQDMIDENQRLLEDNRKLTEANRRLDETLTTVRELEATAAQLQEENKRLNEGMSLVKDLTEENGRQGEEIKRLTDSLNQCLDENKALTNRLIDAALQNEDDLFDAAFADPDDEPSQAKPRMARQASVADPETEARRRAEAEAAQKRQQELEQQAREREAQQRADAERRAELAERASSQLDAFEKSRKVSADQYKKASKGAFARLSQFNKQVAAQQTPSRSPRHLPRPSPPTRRTTNSEVLSTPEADTDFTPRDLDADSASTAAPGLVGLDEAVKRRSQAEEAKAELARKIEGLRGRTSEVPEHRRTTSDIVSRREAEQEHSQASARRLADDQVRGAYYRFAGNADVGSFMKALGFPGFSPGSASSSAGPQDEFRRAIRATAEAASTQQSGASQRAVAESANARLREWQADYNAGGL